MIYANYVKKPTTKIIWEIKAFDMSYRDHLIIMTEILLPASEYTLAFMDSTVHDLSTREHVASHRWIPTLFGLKIGFVDIVIQS